jgi:ELWxxDGT repeat protein
LKPFSGRRRSSWPVRRGSTSAARPEPLEARVHLAATLPRDVNATPVDAATFGQFVPLGDRLYYVHDDGLHGAELFRSDGTAGGTLMVKDVRPGETGSSISGLAAVNGALFFGADDGTNGKQVWRSDGTDAGTVRPFGVLPITSPTGFTAGPGGSLFFFARNKTTNANELWFADAAGAHLLKSLTAAPSNPVAFNGAFYFISGTSEVWRSDGTAGGTAPLKSFASPTLPVANLTATDNRLYFSVNYNDLYVSDGTAGGTGLLKNLGVAPLEPIVGGLSNFLAVGNSLFFTYNDDGATGNELWIATPTTAARVKDINPGLDISSNPSMLTAFHGKAYFIANTDANGIDLWVSDGTDAGTQIAADLRAPALYPPAELAAAGDSLYLSASADIGGALGAQQLGVFVSDGTAAGTKLLRAFDGYNDFKPIGFTAVNGKVLFAAKDSQAGAELWSTIGTPESTHLVRDVYPVTDSSAPIFAGTLNGRLVYFADDGIHGSEPWITDGTAAGTTMLTDIRAGSAGSGTGTGGIATSKYVFFEAADAPGAHQLWRTDGTPGGTIKLASLTDKVQGMVVVDDRPYFFVNHTGYFTSDGTPAGTVPAGDAGQIVQYPRIGTAFYGPGTDASFGTELYRYDPNPTNPLAYTATRLTDINPHAANASPTGLTAIGDTLYFFADDDATARNKLYKYTAAGGATLVRDVLPGADDYLTGGIGTAGGKLYFAPPAKEDVYVSDGTFDGTKLAYDGPGMVSPMQFYGLDGVLLFKAANRLYRTDGTPAGTFPLGSLSPLNLVIAGGARAPRVGNFVYFAATATGDAAASLWRTDGTAAGTTQVDTLNVDTQGVAIGDKVLVAATGRLTGKEVWAVTTAVQPPPPLLNSIGINGGAAQRSRVNSFTLSFDRPVTLAAGAATLRLLNTGGSGSNDGSGPTDVSSALAAPTTPDDGRTWVYTLVPDSAFVQKTSTGASTDSLLDGIYSVSVDPAKVTANGVAMTATPASLTFHRLFGDTNGDATVNPLDYLKFRGTFGKSDGDAGFDGTFDFNNDGTVNPLDYTQFRQRFGKAFSY